MSKISQYAQDTSPSLTDYLIGVEASGPTTKRYVLSDVLNLFLNNIPAAEGGQPFTSTGMVWSGDAYASTRAASMTSGRVKVNTTFLSIAAVTSRVFTASKDTYVDVLDNGDGTGTLVYTEVANNAASPALASNSARIAIIITGASNIANVGSINQGQENKLLPINSSNPYAVTDSLGNLICNRNGDYGIIGQRQITTNQSTASTTEQGMAGLSVPCIIPVGRKLSVEIETSATYSTTSNGQCRLQLWMGTVGSGTELAVGISGAVSGGGTGIQGGIQVRRTFTPASTGLQTINASIKSNGVGTATFECGATGAGGNVEPGSVIVRVV